MYFNPSWTILGLPALVILPNRLDTKVRCGLPRLTLLNILKNSARN